MKKLSKTLAVLAAMMVCTFTATAQLNEQEKTNAEKLLTETQADVEKAIAGLNAAQLDFKPAADKWSAAECIKHIAASETSLWNMVKATLEKEANPADRANIKITDEELVKGVKDRSNKAKTSGEMEPANTSYKTTEEALAAFKDSRAKLIAFVTSTNADLRNHVLTTPMGAYDAYQFILLIGAHSNRHAQQIEEVKAAEGFPKE